LENSVEKVVRYPRYMLTTPAQWNSRNIHSVISGRSTLKCGVTFYASVTRMVSWGWNTLTGGKVCTFVDETVRSVRLETLRIMI
jgi:hypothetical protein